MKAWEIVGWTHDGAAYCPGCASGAGCPSKESEQEDKEWTPVFASDESWESMTCDGCLATLGD